VVPNDKNKGDLGLDVVIKDGLLIDGTSAASRQADVGIKGGRIVAVGKARRPRSLMLTA
jgi:N-acyl-D-aspartate/D-glutamate deacylase